jgi:tetratricopeptide (TPR) repeat protein
MTPASETARPVRRGLEFSTTATARELAAVVLACAPVETAAVILRFDSLPEGASVNRARALLPYQPSFGEASPDESDLMTAEAFALRGRELHCAGDLAGAERCYIESLEHDEACELAHRSFGELLEELAELNDARTAYLWATKSSETVPGWLGIARIESALGNRSDLEPPLVRALRAATSIPMLLDIAVTAAAVGQLKLSTAGLRAAARIDDTDPELVRAVTVLERAGTDWAAART